MNSRYSEDTLVEQPAIELFKELGWQVANCYQETFGPNGSLGRETAAEVVLVSRLRPALERLNPDLPAEAITIAIEALTRDRSAMSSTEANRQIYKLLKDGVRADLTGMQASSAPSHQPSPKGRAGNEESVVRVKVIDWDNPKNNDFFLASQFWITGDMYKRRADLIGFVNGLPLVFIELKKLRTEDAFHHNLRDYKNTVPKLFWYNAFIILSHGSRSLIGSLTADLDHFVEWKKINDEGDEGIVSLETMIRGTCEPARLLDLVENFTLFIESEGGLLKLLAKNHQYLGVSRAIKAVEEIRKNQGKLGVFWHTQGSGKSYSMVFFSQRILRKLPGNWTFLVVTDREDLDDQIYKNFAGAGAVAEPENQVRANSGEHLKQLLREDHRHVFTLVQKFRTDKGKTYPKLSDRSDIIVITDEAHRSQYDQLALNMRNALPNAAFIAFTGTPLMAGEERTKEVFGDYISVYNFRQSVDDHATVPLFYENRIPELQLVNEELNEDMAQVIEEAELTEEQEEKLEREFAREYQLITRDDRLEKVAEDIVRHFAGRGFQGKAMVISLDKATAVRMFDKVHKYWHKHLRELESKLSACAEDEHAELADKIALMRKTDMAVVVSQSQNEVEDLAAKGANIVPHRKRMLKEDLDTKFKDASDPLRLVFVCAMWITGFDVPSCSTIYLDKPMRNHTLMQTIARANRVFRNKVNGLIVDYVGVFRNLQKALAIYGAGGGINPGETPVKDKQELVELLRGAINSAEEFCADRWVDLPAIRDAGGFTRVKLLDDAVEPIVESDESKEQYRSLTNNVTRLYKAILPDPFANEFGQINLLLSAIQDKIQALAPIPDISDVLSRVETLLDTSIASEGYVIHETDRIVDLSKIDFDALQKQFARGRKHTEVERLRNVLAAKLAEMVILNRTRMDYLEHFQEMIDEYNSGAVNVEVTFERLVEFTKGLNAEDQRHIAEQLNVEELAVFDLLTKPEISLTEKERNEVKKVARELLQVLKREKLVLDWRARQQARAGVRLTIEESLDHLPRVYSKQVYGQKCDLIYQHVFDSYFGSGNSIYPRAA
ncbi:MAG: type I restriction endonuclease subunit R [Pyrinomonadaceae bacterium]